jgi:hypothetical protein
MKLKISSKRQIRNGVRIGSQIYNRYGQNDGVTEVEATDLQQHTYHVMSVDARMRVTVTVFDELNNKVASCDCYIATIAGKIDNFHL